MRLPSTRFPCGALVRIVLLFSCALWSLPARANYITLWTLGTTDGSANEFGSESYNSNAAPGSATARDDDFYFAGDYPVPVGTHPSTESLANHERAVSQGDPNNRYHFTLTATQAASTLRIRLVARMIWGGWWNPATNSSGEGYGTHTVTVRLNGADIGTQTFATDGTLLIQANAGVGAGKFTPVTGENILQISRTGGTANGYIAFDDLGFEINPTALVDADSDGLPQWWEQDQGLSDSNGSDALQDTDVDGLTNTQELARGTLAKNADTDGDGLRDGFETGTLTYVSPSNTGTDPLKADSDGDSLSDGFELAQSPVMHPLLTDSDNDGAKDAWEVRTGYSPTSASSFPPAAWDKAIGIQFISQLSPASALTALDVSGMVPQQNWNRTTPLSIWGEVTGVTTHITGPVAGTLVNSAGANTTATVAWTAEGTWTSGNGGGSNQRLLSGYLVGNNSGPADVTLSSIPAAFATYDVFVYVGNGNTGSYGYARLNDNSGGGTDRHFAANSTRPVDSFNEPVLSNPTRPWRGNVIHFRNVTGSSVNVKLFAVGDTWETAGIHAIQIVNSTANSDADTMPDWWEFMHTLKPDANDGALDPDSDGLTNVQEFTRGTDPHQADTDGDGLTDVVETNTSTWVSAANTGSNPLLPDTDSDTISDGDEVATLPMPTNPNETDTDDDGRSDAEERDHHTDPVVTTAANAQMPLMNASPHSFDWTLDNVQLVWDHTRGHASGSEWGDTYLTQLSISNSATQVWDHAVRFGLRHVQGRIVHFFYAGHNGGFSSTNQPSNDIWESDWASPPTDRKAALGFSGYGTHDISDRLRFRLTGTSTGARNAWSITYELRNMDTNVVVRTVTFPNCTASTGIHNATASWQTDDNPPIPNRVSIDLHPGVSIYFQSTPLENTAAFSAWKDTDEDGMTDAWEDANAFNKNSNADAALDTDSDGLSNLRESLAGTNPRQRDSDGDTVADGLEVNSGSNPLLASSRPAYFSGPPAGITGEDLNGNGLNDAWELWVGSFGLNPSADIDGDGQNNAQEALAGTDPRNTASHLWSAPMRSGDDIILRWPRIPQKQHRVWESSNLNSWSIVPGTPATVGDEYRQTFSNAITPNLPKFYRAGLNDLDTDGDGVNDWTETNVLNSSTTNANSLRSALATDANGDGTTDGTLNGDYAALLERLQGGAAGGGFPNGSGPDGTGSTGTGISRSSASRFLTQATFGPVPADIERVQQVGYAGWIDEQKTKPATLHSTYMRSIQEDYFGPRADSSYNASDTDEFLFGGNLSTAFARAAIQGEDQLRQRVAFALSQILVASRRDANLENRGLGMADFYDIFVRHAFGNYFDVVHEVALHPCMGRYLSHVGNQKAKPEINQYPDENFARESMQLFTIGLWELNPDGTRKVNGSGQDIPTYSNAEITQLARVMTGLWFSGYEWGNGGWSDEDYATPMTMHADRHDFGSKTLVHGVVIPARAPSAEEGLRDIHDAMHALFEHPNCGPFIGKQLIQFLVTDNPSPAYVGRISAVFADNGSGVRGDLGAVVKAILLDDEARNPHHADVTASYGRLKEPVIRAMSLARAFGMRDVPDLLWWDWGEFFADARQEATYSPSVFNFYRPEYRAAGLLTQNDLAGPVFQITDSYSAIAFPNRLWSLVEDGFQLWGEYQFPLDLSRESALATSPGLLVDHLNTLFCAGRMSAATRSVILTAIQQLPADQPDARARIAAYLAIVSPEGAVMK